MMSYSDIFIINVKKISQALDFVRVMNEINQ
jgi:hypothetical protein